FLWFCIRSPAFVSQCDFNYSGAAVIIHVSLYCSFAGDTRKSSLLKQKLWKMASPKPPPISLPLEGIIL
uniref:Uncharacterized protein n=1 Tax=Anas zonorhyncha TaxID=75864 RepID=A0A8B9UWF4_9AVES